MDNKIEASQEPALDSGNSFAVLLFLSVFAVATCGLIYELVAGALASYLLGDSVTQFSLVIGVYLFSMGVGSFASRYIHRNLMLWFVRIELLVGIVGGFSSTLLFVLFDHVGSFQIILYALVFVTGALVGLEIPLLMAILKDRYEFRDLVSRVFSFDYVGALLASIIFPLILVPYFGLIRTSFFFGILNVSVALILCYRLSPKIPWVKWMRGVSMLILLILLTGFLLAERIMEFADQQAYGENIIFAKNTKYQRLVLTSGQGVLKLHLNGNLQFSSLDEYRYHEALVHPAMLLHNEPKAVLVLGGGDGLAVREILKHETVNQIVLVDLDKEMTDLFKSSSALVSLNDSSFFDNKVTIYNQDAFEWLKSNEQKFDVVVIDFPDPSNFSLGKLYSLKFYRELMNHFDQETIGVIQSTSPFYAPNSFWCIDHTTEASGFTTLPYHCYVPSFGEWGFIGIAKNGFGTLRSSDIPFRFFSESVWNDMKNFPSDMADRPTEVNKLNNQMLVHYFDQEWSQAVQ